MKRDEALKKSEQALEELAMALEDVVIRLINDPNASKAYFSQGKSPFPDVPSSVAWYNAAMVCVGRNLMKTDISGAFRPNDPVSGAEMLSAITRLRDVINK